ncbi:unnamed protein product [Brassica oleracea var. botrytis]
MNPAVEVFLWIFDEVAGICLMLYAMVAHGIHHRLAPLVFFLLYYFKVLRRGDGCGCQSMHWFWW